jgi:hypothetical protein
MTTRISSSRLVGRRAELSELEAALADADAARGGVTAFSTELRCGA